MKKLFVTIAIMLATACNINAQGTQNRTESNATLVGSTFVQSKRNNTTGAIKTAYNWKSAKGEVYPLWLSKNGHAFVVRVSRNGNEYKDYNLGGDGQYISQTLCAKLGVTYVPSKSRTK